MADVAQTETIARTFVPEGHKTVATLTPEQEVRKSRAERIRQRVKDNDPQAAIQEAFGAKDRDRDLGFDSQANLDRRLGANIPAVGSKDRPAYVEAKNILSASQNLVEGRLKPGDPQFNELRAEIMIRLNMKGRGFDELASGEKLAVAERMLTDPEFQKKLRGELAKTLEEGRPVDEQIKTVEQALKDAQDLYDQKNGEVTTKSDELKDVDARLTSEFGKKGAKAKQIDSLANQGYADGSLYDRPINDVVRLVLKKTMTPAQITTEIAQARLDRKKGLVLGTPQQALLDLSDEIQKRQEYTGLLDERKGLEDKKKELEGRSTSLTKELKELQDARDARQKERDDVNSTEKTRQDRVMIDRAKALVGEAAEQYIDGEVEKMAEVWEDIVKEEESSTKDRDVKKLSEAVNSRWKKIEYKVGSIFNTGGKIDTKYDRGKIDTDIEIFSKDPAIFIEGILKEGVTDPIELSQIDKRMKDSSFVKEWKGKIATELVRDKLLGSHFWEIGRVTSAQGERLLNDPDIAEAMSVELVKKAHEIETKTGKTGLAAQVEKLANAKDRHGLLYAMALLIGAPMIFVGKQIAH